jgi:uncharacterized protein (TIGR03435 family)
MQRSRSGSGLLLVLASAIAGASVIAQSPSPQAGNAAFDVVSVKRTAPGARGNIAAMAVGPGQVSLRPGGRLAAPMVTLRDLVRAAYAVEDLQVVGGPAWASADRFDIEATTRPEATTDDVRIMLRALLRDRFKLDARMDTRELPVSVLELARTDGRLGPQLRRAGADCAPPTPPANMPSVPPPPPPPPGGGRALLIMTTPFRCPAIVTPWHMSLRAATMSQFAYRLTAFLRRLVTDRSGLAGEYDLDLTYAPDPGVPPPMVNGTALTIDAPALPTAMRDQLGLKLETSRTPVQVVVIDRADPPTEN